MLKAQAKNFPQDRLCQRVARKAAAKAELDVLVIDVHHHKVGTGSEDCWEESSQAVQDGKRLQEPDVLVPVAAWDVAKEGCKGSLSWAEVPTHCARARVGPDVGDQEGAVREDRGTAPAREQIAPPAEFGDCRTREAECRQWGAVTATQGRVQAAKVCTSMWCHLRHELEQACNLLQLQEGGTWAVNQAVANRENACPPIISDAH